MTNMSEALASVSSNGSNNDDENIFLGEYFTNTHILFTMSPI